MQSIGRVEIDEILKHIHHRYPFLLMDRALDGVPSKWIRVVKNVTANEAFFAGLPPERRTMPRMLLIEAFAQCSGVLCHFSGLSKPMGGTLTFFAGLDHCRFYGDARPGDQLIFECELKRAMRGVVKIAGRGLVDGQVIIELAITAMLRDREVVAMALGEPSRVSSADDSKGPR